MRRPSAAQSRAVAAVPAPRDFPVGACPERIARGCECLLLTHSSITSKGGLPMRRLLIFIAIVCTLSACASSPPQGQRSEFEDIPVPKGLELDWSRSTIIESPTIKAARLFYKGRITPDSLAVAFRSTLDANA